jgi:hypothetical protein
MHVLGIRAFANVCYFPLVLVHALHVLGIIRERRLDMSRKDFRLIAETIKLLPTHQDGTCEVVNVCVVITRFAEALRQTNSRFDAERFIAACTGRSR